MDEALAAVTVESRERWTQCSVGFVQSKGSGHTSYSHYMSKVHTTYRTMLLLLFDPP